MLVYWRERLPLHVFGPVAVALATPANLIVPFDATLWARDIAFALLLLAQFRLWDDLADRPVDVDRHPERVLVRARATRGYIALCVALGLLNALIVFQRGGARVGVPLLAGVTVAVVWAYARSRNLVVKDLLRLVKYPAFVLLIAVGRAGASLSACIYAAVVAFAIAFAYEVAHDHSTPLRGLFRSSP